VRIIIPCHSCSEPKRPLSLCDACGVPADTVADVSAWRLALHAHHMARITSQREVRPPVMAARATASPVQLSIDADHSDPFELLAEGSTLTLEPLFPESGPRSFDWEDGDHRRLRRSA
jgi:hypothetical protein